MYNIARADTLLGLAHLALSRPDEAEERLSSALTTLRDMTANYEIARAVEGLAGVAEQRGDTRAARDHYREATALYSSVGRSRQAEDAEAALRRLRQSDRDEPGG
jgi:tetratricopeptide (TPR) repeat protein